MASLFQTIWNVFYVNERLFNWTKPSWVKKLCIGLNSVHLQLLLSLFVHVWIDNGKERIE